MTTATVIYTKQELQAIYDEMFGCDDPGYEEAINILDEQSVPESVDSAREQAARTWLQQHCTKLQLSAIRVIAGIEV